MPANLKWVEPFQRISVDVLEGALGYVTGVDRKNNIVRCYIYEQGREIDFRSTEVTIFFKSR